MSTAQETTEQDYDPATSLDTIDQALSGLQANRQTHIALSQEVQRLRKWCEEQKNGKEE